MNRILLLPSLLLTTLVSAQTFQTNDFLSSNDSLDHYVDSVFNTLDTETKIGQLLMPAVGRLGALPDSIDSYIRNQKIGGVLLLNGTKEEFRTWTARFNALNQETNNLPSLYSADAEPSLVNRKMIGSKKVLKAPEIKTDAQLEQVTKSICKDLNDVGINYNFAPVVDVSANKTVGYRGFGAIPKNIIPFSEAFISITQQQNIIATAKHFPGHGLVSGDTHKSLQVIDGELKELKNYPPLIESGVLSIMIAHIAIKNNSLFDTQGMPATVSEKIVTGLLRDSLNFKGLIVTDAMNMGGISKIENAGIKAIEAGCDIILMPLNPTNLHHELVLKYKTMQVFEEKVNKAVKRIIRMKICLGLIDLE